MKNLIKLEELAMLGLSIFLFSETDFAWWWYLALILTPDIGILGYALNTKIGAATYNFFHHKAVAISVLCLGWFFSQEWLELAGIILFGHSSLDRLFGYGLKFSDHFKHTHLGWMEEPITSK
ncbi:DUF4260 domain-containing protein [uncultured Roseivirga sp.]|uniref:DUF4260 domain-containing protein n=1 Tax=uncultured Roseivirga sp. TaxID=543088 RepID=UPI000D795E93|nr:DUF4260 domain-containing protein [uncultured Roseivirga sp.]PWL32288.1 MAG: DUF4260 domain-containing protein [Roseivirga sp. XM-24bin3]